MNADQSALTRLLACDLETFASAYWARAALLSERHERGGDTFADLFSLDAVDELLTRRALRTPFIRMAKNGITLPESEYTTSGGIGAGIGDQVSDDAVLSLFADGATVVLQGLHRTWHPITRWSQELAAVMGHPVQVNAYVTPAQSQGFADHYDVHDVFVLQVHGHKRWSIHDPVLPAPLRDQPWGQRRSEVGAAAALAPSIEATLTPGDCLYLPRGYIHSAAALGGVSIHLTVGVHGWTRSDIADALLTGVRSRLSQREDVRCSLALGIDVTNVEDLHADIDVTRAVLIDAIRDAPAAEIAQLLAGRARAAQRPEAINSVSAAAASANLASHETLRLRRHLLLDRHPAAADGSVQVGSRAGRFTLDAAGASALEHLLRVEQSPIGDLADDPNVAVSVAQVLVRRGVAVSVTPQ